MPCDQIQTTACDLTNAHLPSLMKALSALGLEPRQTTDRSLVFEGGRYENGKLSMRSSEHTVEHVKTAYAREVGSYAARQFGFKMTETRVQTRGAIAAYRLTRNR